MAILDEDLERVRGAVGIVEIVGQHVQLKRVGRRWQGLCPFHAEKTPSFSVSEEHGLYYCFGCGKGGDLISFVREVEHTDFVGAVEHLAAKAGITLRYSNEVESRERQRRKQLIDAMAQAVEWYHRRLWEGSDAGPARAYLRSRGIDGEAARRFSIGWAPDGWDELVRALRLPESILTAAGLAFVNSRGRPTDFFRGRIMFPVFSESGDPVAFGGRILPGSTDPAKYKNSPETAIYAKSRTLYGLHWAKADAVAVDEIVVCEGYTDVIGFHRAGVTRAVASCGTALTDEHVRIMQRYARRIVLAFDADEAGQNAAARFYEWERTYGIEVFVAALPRGADPGELATRDLAALATAVRDARPFLGFRVGRVLGSARLDTPEARARAAETALAVIAEHPSDIVRREYAGQVAVRCGLPVEDLVRLAERRVRSPSVRVVTSGPPRLGDGAEVVALRLLVHRFADIAPFLTEVLFTDPATLGAFRAMAAAVEAAPDAPVSSLVHAAIADAEPAAAELLTRLAVDDVEPDVDAAAEARNLVTAVARRAWEREMRQAAQAPELVSLRALGAVRMLIDTAATSDGEAGSDAVGQLLVWLDGCVEERA